MGRDRKVTHYINIVGWKALRFTERDRVFCDSLSLLAVSYMLGKPLVYLPGAKSLKRHGLDEIRSVYLTPCNLSKIPRKQQFVLPPEAEIQISDDLRDWISKKDRLERIYIGIGSPKQNLLGQNLLKEFNVDIFCIGASIFEIGTSHSIIRWSSGKGLEWLFRAIFKPKRFLSKSLQTVVGISEIILSEDRRDEFRNFLESIPS